jgi:hypothetical protein
MTPLPRKHITEYRIQRQDARRGRCHLLEFSIQNNFLGPVDDTVTAQKCSTSTSQETATWGGCDLGGNGFWEQDYGWGVRVRRHFGARGMSSVRYGIRLGDLKENWFLCFPIKHSTHTHRVTLENSDNSDPLYGIIYCRCNSRSSL